MKLTVLGKYGPYPPINGATSGYLLQTDSANVLLDLGSGTLSRLKEKVGVKDISFIVFSHLHFDHVSDFGVLSYELSFSGRKDKVNVYLPNFDCEVYSALSKISCFNLINVEEGKVYKQDGLEFSFYKMTHPVLSYGVKFYNGDKTFAYTGDTTLNDNLPSLLQGVDLAVVDGAFLEKDFISGKPHLSIKQASSLTAYANKVIVSHISPSYSDEEVIKEITSVSKKAEIAIEKKTYLV